MHSVHGKVRSWYPILSSQGNNSLGGSPVAQHILCTYIYSDGFSESCVPSFICIWWLFDRIFVHYLRFCIQGHFIFLCPTLTINFTNKMWVICHRKYVIGRIFQRTFWWHMTHILLTKIVSQSFTRKMKYPCIQKRKEYYRTSEFLYIDYRREEGCIVVHSCFVLRDHASYSFF